MTIALALLIVLALAVVAAFLVAVGYLRVMRARVDLEAKSLDLEGAMLDSQLAAKQAEEGRFKEFANLVLQILTKIWPPRTAQSAAADPVGQDVEDIMIPMVSSWRIPRDARETISHHAVPDGQSLRLRSPIILRNSDEWIVEDIRIDGESFFKNRSGIPGHVFAPDAQRIPYDVRIRSSVELDVRYVGDLEERQFLGYLLCRDDGAPTSGEAASAS